MMPYSEWPIVHSDPIGLEARRNPEDPSEYGIGRIVRLGDEIIPIMFLPRGTLQQIATTTLSESASGIIRLSQRRRIGSNEEMNKFEEEIKRRGFEGYIEPICILDLFLKSTYIHLARKGDIMI